MVSIPSAAPLREEEPELVIESEAPGFPRYEYVADDELEERAQAKRRRKSKKRRPGSDDGGEDSESRRRRRPRRQDEWGNY
jgi:hypothetical protein